MAESIDPNAISRGEPGNEQAGLPKSLWEDETEIPRTLANSAAPTNRHGWLAAAVAFGSACLVLAAGGIIAWRQPNPQNGAEPQLGQSLAPSDNRPPSAVSQIPLSSNVDSQSRQLAVSPAIRPTSDAPAETTQPALAALHAPIAESPRRAPAPAAEPTRSPVAFRWAINRVRSALVAGDMKRAQRSLELAAQSADSPVQKGQVAQFRALDVQLERFWAAVRAGLKVLEPAEEVHIDGAIASVIESGPDSLALFVTGSRRDYTLANLPAKVALFVAARGVNESAPAHQVFLGAFHAVHPRGDRDRARQLWDSAAAAGEPVGDLLPFLDPLALAIERESVPDPERLAESEAALEGKFRDAIGAAKTAQRKSQLAASLMSAASDAETSPEQYALLHQAASFAIAAADSQAALRAIDERARWFEVDAWTLKSAALAEAAAAFSTPASAQQIATSALELSGEAEAQGLREQAQSLAATAQSAARKSRDRELLKKAAQRVNDLKKLEPQPAKAPAAVE